MKKIITPDDRVMIRKSFKVSPAILETGTTDELRAYILQLEKNAFYRLEQRDFLLDELIDARFDKDKSLNAGDELMNVIGDDLSPYNINRAINRILGDR